MGGVDLALLPSALPDISPSRGEILRSHTPRLKLTPLAEHSTIKKHKVAPHPISPLEEEMSGRTEGDGRLLQRPLVHLFYTSTSETVRG